MKMRNRMLMDLDRGNNKHRAGDPLDPEIEEGEEVPEVGVGYQAILEDREADMEPVCSPGVLNLPGGLNLPASIDIEVTATVHVFITAVVVSRWA